MRGIESIVRRVVKEEIAGLVKLLEERGVMPPGLDPAEQARRDQCRALLDQHRALLAQREQERVQREQERQARWNADQIKAREAPDDDPVFRSATGMDCGRREYVTPNQAFRLHGGYQCGYEFVQVMMGCGYQEVRLPAGRGTIGRWRRADVEALRRRDLLA